jgi:hypothetical protein
MDRGSEHQSALSLGPLLGGIANDAKDLFLQEVALTKLEVRNELNKAKTAAIGLSIGSGIIAAGGVLLMLMVVHLLDALTVVPLWGCYGVVGGVLVGLGGLLLATGKTQAEELQAVPQCSAERIKESAQWLTKQTTSAKR